jgi:hypothetical protein
MAFEGEFFGRGLGLNGVIKCDYMSGNVRGWKRLYSSIFALLLCLTCNVMLCHDSEERSLPDVEQSLVSCSWSSGTMS